MNSRGDKRAIGGEQLGSIMSRITIGEGKSSKYNQTGNQEESKRAIKVIKVTD